MPFFSASAMRAFVSSSERPFFSAFFFAAATMVSTPRSSTNLSIYFCLLGSLKGSTTVAPEISNPSEFFAISSGAPMMMRLAMSALSIFSAASNVLLSIDSGRTMVFLSALALAMMSSINAIYIHLLLEFLVVKSILVNLYIFK